LELLYALGALDKKGNLNAVGKRMSRFPLEPMAAKAICASADEGCSEDVIAVLSMLTTDSVFRFQGSNMSGERSRKNLGREQYARKEGDHTTLLEVFRAFKVCGVKRRREFCNTNAINLRAMLKALDIFKQLSRAATHEGIEFRASGAESAPLLRSMVSGYFLNTARKQADGSYRTVSTGQRLVIHPSSVLFQQPPEMIIFNELVKTNRLYARDVSSILPEWLAEMSPNVYSMRKE
jgi:HrpA-like RNA helicase